MNNGQDVDFTKVPDRTFERTAKLFTPELQEGKVGLYRADVDESITFDFDTEEVPYLGLWLCYGCEKSMCGGLYFCPCLLYQCVRWCPQSFGAG